MASKLLQESLGLFKSICQVNPEAYFKDRLAIPLLWDGEIAILEAIPKAIEQKKQKIVVPSGHSLGKDFICAGLVPYFLEVYGPCVVITTAPTDRQVSKIMWGEIATHYNRPKVKPAGELLMQEIKIAPNWYAIGFTTKDTGSMVGKFQGFHNPRVFVVVSEAQAVEDSVFEQIDAIMTGEIGLMIEIGNPLRATGQFAKDINNKKDNIVITLSCLDSPNYKERRSVIPGVCSYEWVEAKRKAWGEDDPRWQARVLGRIPKQSIDSVFSTEVINSMIDRNVIIGHKVYRGASVDVARFGDDETCIYGGMNGMIEATDIYSGVSTTATASRALIVNNKIKGNFIVVDGDGLGAGTIDTLRDMQLRGVDLIEIHSAQKDGVDPQYENRRAEMWFKVKERAENGLCMIPNDPLLIEELMAVRYFINKRGKIQIESKDDLKGAERLGRSPDRADSWIMLQWGFSQATAISPKDAYARDDEKEIARGGVGASIYNGAGAMAA